MAGMTAEQASPAGVTEAIRALDKAARKGSIHHRNAARRKSRLLKRLAAIGLQLPSGAAQPDSAPAQAVPARGRRSTKVEKGAAPEAETKDVASYSVLFGVIPKRKGVKSVQTTYYSI